MAAIVFLTKAFSRWAAKEGVADAAILATVEEIEAGLAGNELGSGLFKKRVARTGAGKSGGYRTILAY